MLTELASWLGDWASERVIKNPISETKKTKKKEERSGESETLAESVGKRQRRQCKAGNYKNKLYLSDFLIGPQVSPRYFFSAWERGVNWVLWLVLVAGPEAAFPGVWFEIGMCDWLEITLAVWVRVAVVRPSIIIAVIITVVHLFSMGLICCKPIITIFFLFRCVFLFFSLVCSLLNVF